MAKDCCRSNTKTLQHQAAQRYGGRLGKLAAVPRFELILTLLVDSAGRACYAAIHRTIERLGHAMQLGQHRRLINLLDSCLNDETLAAMTSLALHDAEVCAALAVYLTTLEQAYHWPQDTTVTTPFMVENHKLVIQMLNQPQLTAILQASLDDCGHNEQDQNSSEIAAQTALRAARSLLKKAQFAKEREIPLTRDFQDTVNLLYRTCRSDWSDQGDYRDVHSHKEFGRLHEVIRASGTQRRMQDLFEESGGLSSIQVMSGILEQLPSSSNILCSTLTQLQFAVAIAREELFTVSVDEAIWGRVFANFSKAVGFCDISAGGGDAPIFWMLDTLCGQADPKRDASLPEELSFRSRFFPDNVRALLQQMHDFPMLRAYCNSSVASKQVRQSFRALERQRFELYEMHRKKAARIGLSLRAGQRGTSAGVSGCAYATPEKHLAKTLSAAMAARFGGKPDNLFVDAEARSHTLMLDEQGCIYSARVQFEFETPLVIGPGDCLLVSVQMPDNIWRTRTYSVTYTHVNHQPLEKDAHQIAGVAEVYVRSKGMVSAYLCSQTHGCKVRVAIKPASHFRLVTNSAPTDTTVLVAQGGALGIYVAWLQALKQPTGQYVLVIGSQRFSQLGFKIELLQIAKTMRQYLRIVVVLSRPDATDAFKLKAADMQVFHGRVNQYFDCNPLKEVKAVFVCGTSSFGLDVAKSVSCSQQKSNHSSRLEEIITSRLPPIRLHVAPEAPVMRRLPTISPAELAQHNSPSDLWIAVGDSVYDITSLSKFHPGGEKILMARAGRQARELFKSVHGGSVDIASLMHNMIIGHLGRTGAKHTLWQSWLDKMVEIQNDLTNHSRFEQLPGNSVENLPEVPPTHVIYASVECFSAGWCELLQEIGLPGMMQCHLMRAWLGLKKTFDAWQAAVYSESSDDLEQYGSMIRLVFSALRTISGEIHTILDELKAHVALCITQDSALDIKLFEVATDQVIKLVNQQEKGSSY